jgi:hypothetical protein
MKGSEVAIMSVLETLLEDLRQGKRGALSNDKLLESTRSMNGDIRSRLTSFAASIASIVHTSEAQVAKEKESKSNFERSESESRSQLEKIKVEQEELRQRIAFSESQLASVRLEAEKHQKGCCFLAPILDVRL